MDLIDRQAAIDALIEWYGCEPSDIGAFENIIEKLPPAQPELCEDAVSRADVEIEIANILRGVFVEYQDIAKKTASKLPPVTPKRKTGKWVFHRPPDDWVLALFTCDQCGYMNEGESRYCPGCGAKMEVKNE